MADTNIHPIPTPSATEAELLQRLQSLAGELAVASLPILPLLTNSLNIYAARARQGDGHAKDTLHKFLLAIDDARTAEKSIAIARTGPPVLRKT